MTDQSILVLHAQAEVERLKAALHTEKARADRAEACCAEMRGAIGFMRILDVTDLALSASQKESIEHAISNDCGKGLLTELEQLKARNQRLREALKEIKRSSAPYYMRDVAREALAAEKEKP